MTTEMYHLSLESAGKSIHWYMILFCGLNKNIKSWEKIVWFLNMFKDQNLTTNYQKIGRFWWYTMRFVACRWSWVDNRPSVTWPLDQDQSCHLSWDSPVVTLCHDKGVTLGRLSTHDQRQTTNRIVYHENRPIFWSLVVRFWSLNMFKNQTIFSHDFIFSFNPQKSIIY